MRKTYIALVIFLCVVAGILLGNMMARRANLENSVNTIQMLFRQLGQGNVVDELLHVINAHYFEEVDINQLTEDALIFILSELDPHSTLIPARDLADVNSELEGSFSGIGVQFNIHNDTVLIISVINGGPSQRIGLLAGDRIVEVEDSVFVGPDLTNERVFRTLRGKRNTQIRLGIKRRGVPEILHYTITRGDIPTHSIDIAYMIEPDVGYIRMSRFSATTYSEMLTAIASLRNQGMRKLILDLRENTGGLLDQAIMITNEFLPRGQLIVSSEGRAVRRLEARADGSGNFVQQPLVILIDEFSASASEILAGAVQDNDRGLIIGRRSAGKGLVQQQITLSNGSAVRLTVSQYFTPSGRSIQRPFERGGGFAYEMEMWERLLHDDDTEAEVNTQFPDSAVYHTLKGREVHGGGGIMPDILMPRDMSNHTPYLNRVVGLLHQFAIQYSDQHREQLNAFNTWQAMERHLLGQNLLHKFVAFAESRNVPPNWDEINQSRQFIEQRLIASITRNMLGEEGFFPLLNYHDPVVNRALKELRTNEMFR